MRTNVKHQSACWAPEVHTFWPFTTKSSPSRTAAVRSDARSLPASGSLMPSPKVSSPRRQGTAKRSTCSGVPRSTIDGEMIDSPCGL